MCLDVRKTCKCGRETIQFHLRDNLMLPEVIARLFCPRCPADTTAFNPQCMLHDNGWTIEYDLTLARMLAVQKLLISPEKVTPEFIFDRGYACWLETYPGEKEDIREERAEIIDLLAEDQQKYLETIRDWNIRRLQELKKAGWRRAHTA